MTQRIRYKILGLIVPMMVLCIIAVLGVFERRNAADDREMLQNRLDERLLLQSKVLAQPVWNLADEQVLLVLDALVTDPEVVGAAVIDDSGALIASQGNLEELDAGGLSARQDIVFDMNGSPRVIGALRITVTDAELITDRNARLVFVIVLAALLILAVVVTTLMAVDRVVGRPMNLLLNSIRKTEKDGVREPVPFASRDEFGTVIQAYNAMLEQQDVAERKLRSVNDELEHRVRERTRDLSLARDEATRASEAKSTFLATMSHEIRTPLNGITGMSLLLEGTDLNEEQQDFTTSIRSASDTLMNIINDILDFSKIEAGAIDLERIPLDVNEVVESAAELIAPRASEKRLELACVVDASVPPGMMGDPTRLKQVMMNLLNNAVKFTERGEVVLSVTLTTLTDGAPAITFAVKDTGIGISREQMGRLFKSFSQVDASTTRRYGGSGLGLVITKRFAELMGGDITVESVEGQGTTFKFTIPFEKAEVPQRQNLKDQMKAVAGKRVLLVDDNRTNLTILTTKLEHWGMRVTAFDASTDAMAAMPTVETYDICILDFLMPDLDGFDLVHAWREQGLKLPKLLLHTSVAPTDDLLSARLDDGMFAAVLLKPARTSHLLGAMVRAFQTEEALPTAGKSATSVPLDPEDHLQILLVDDNALNRKVASKILLRLGYTPDIASGGQQAVDACLKTEYDVVLMDIEMPEMDGLAATQHIRSQLPEHQVPFVVALTANAMNSDREIYLKSGMDRFLSKPIDLDALKTTLHDAVERKKAREMAKSAG